MSYKIKIITLNKESKNSKELLNSIEKQGLTAELYDAIDGRNTIPKLLKNESIDQHRSEKYRLSILNSPEIGAYLSHYRCIQSAYEQNIKKICILEDDVNIDTDFGSTLNQLLDLPEKYEFIRLMELKRCKRKIVKNINEKHLLTRPEKGTLGAQGYLLNRAGMKKIIDNAMPIWKPIDKFYDHYWEIDLQSFSIEPHLIWETLSESSIKKPNFRPHIDFYTSALWTLQKLKRSIKRKIYILKRRVEFYPKSKSSIKMGKTIRKG